MAKTRRPHGAGSYDKLTDEKGNVTYYRWRIGIYDPAAGKTRYKSIKARTRAALEEKIAAWKEENSGGAALPPLPNRLTVRQWTEKWLAGAENKIAQTTFAQYKHTADMHILPNFGKLWLNKVSTFMLQSFFDELSKTHSPATVATIRGHFRVCFAKAVKYGILSRNPVTATDPPKYQKPNLKILEETEVKRILEVAKDFSYHSPVQNDSNEYTKRCNYLIILLAVASGMRRGEILGLTWPCVEGTQIEVKYALQALTGDKRKLKPPKNGKSRIVAIPATVAEKLQEWREFQAAYAEKYNVFFENKLDLVFTTAEGTPIFGCNFTHRQFQAVCVKAKVEGARFHDLRHFWASSALSKGVPLAAVSEQLGHSSIDITLRRYTHALKRSRDELKAMLDENPLFKEG